MIILDENDIEVIDKPDVSGISAEIEVVDDVEIVDSSKNVNVFLEMCKCWFSLVFWTALAFFGFLALSKILDMIF